MTWSIFLVAVGLLFVFEGLLPSLAPRFWRYLMQHMSHQNDRALRVMGLISMIIGLMIVCITRDLYFN